MSLGKSPEEAASVINKEESSVSHSYLLQYRRVLEHIIPVFEAGNSEHRWDMDLAVDGIFEDRTYKIRFPHLRKGKHAAVGIVDIANPDGTTFECVIRNSPDDAMEYLKAAKHDPLVAEYSPQLFGIVDGWVVMEKLAGLELQELDERLRVDPEFLSRYAQNTQELINKLADAHLVMDDVRFINGHNVMVEPETAEVKIIEQKAIHPCLDPRESFEIETAQLFYEAAGIMYMGDRTNVPAHRARFLFELCQNAFKHKKPEDLYVRSRVIKPTHPDYKDAWLLQNWEKLSEEEYQRILADPNLREKFTINYYDRGFSETFDPGFVEAIIKGDFSAFQEIVRNGNYKTDITDKNDPRAQILILPDAYGGK